MKRKKGQLVVSFDCIPVNSVIYNPLNLRGVLRSPEQIVKTANSILEVGLIHHPVVSFTVGGPLVVAGEQRMLAHEYLSQRMGFKHFDEVVCKVLEGVSETLAMKILAEENLAHGTTVPAATANELYWHYRVDMGPTGNHKRALQSIVEKGWSNPSFVLNSIIMPGWFLYHSPTIQNIFKQVGPKREGLENPEVQELVKNVRGIRLGWWAIIASAFRALEPREFLAPPKEQELQEFDKLMQKAFEILEDPVLRGKSAETELEQVALPIRQERLEGILVDNNDSTERRDAARRELIFVKRMLERRAA